MAGLLSEQFFQTLNGAGSMPGGGLLSGPGPTGLLNPWKPAPDEGLLTRLLGSNDPRDPRGAQMMALATGLIRGDLAGGFEGATRARYNHEAQQSRRLADSMTLTKTAYELQQMQDAMRRNRAIQEERASGYGGGSYIPALTTGAGPFGVPTVGDMPMFSMGSQPQTRTMGAPAGLAGAPGVPGARPGAASPQENIYRQLLAEAALYQKYGDTKTALEYYQRAEQFKPKFSTTPQVMRDPRTNQLVQVTLNEEGGYQILPFGAKPDVSLQDLGGRVVAIDRNTAQDGASWGKTMTPGESASNSLGWANNRLSRDRLAFEQGKPELRDVNGQLVAVYPNAQGGPSVRPVNGPGGVPLGGGDPKLTEVQGNATQFISRMRDASRTLEQVTKDGAPWPSTVERAGYKPELPSWLPGGQIVSAGISAANKAMTPVAALQVRQAQDNWITANLRKESGAAIPVPELEAERQKWFPMPGEGEATAKQKAAARRVAEEAMLVQAGPGGRMVPQVLERADAAGAKQGGQKSAAKPVPLPSTNAKDLKHGTAYQLPNGTVGRWDGLKRRFEVVQ